MNSVFQQVPAFKPSRHASLFSDFSKLKEINPEGFDANVTAWNAVLQQCLQLHTFNSSITLPANRLASTLQSPQYGKAKSLDLVIKLLVEQREFLLWSKFRSGRINKTFNVDFAYPNKVWENLKAAIGSFFYSASEQQSFDEYYLHWPTLTERASDCLTRLKNKVNDQGSYVALIMNFQMFCDSLKQDDSHLSNVDIEAILIYLSRSQGLFAERKGSSRDERCPDYLIKIDTANSITPEDFKILGLKENILSIQSRVSVLQNYVDVDIPQQLHRMLSSNASKSLLKNMLLRKAYVLQSLELTHSALNQLVFLTHKIDDAHSNAAIFGALKSAESVLANLNRTVSAEDLDEAMSEMGAQVSQTQMISEKLGGFLIKNDDDIDEELKVLEAEYHASLSTPKNTEKLEDLHHLGSSGNSSSDAQTGKIGLANLNEDSLTAKLQNLLIQAPRAESPIRSGPDTSRGNEILEESPKLA